MSDDLHTGSHWTPELVIARGLGPADVADILRREGWRIVYAPPKPFAVATKTEREPGGRMRDIAVSGSPRPPYLEALCEVLAVRGTEERELCDRMTSTRKREAKILSEALGGCYSFTTGPAPSEWPEDWDHARHDLARLLNGETL